MYLQEPNASSQPDTTGDANNMAMDHKSRLGVSMNATSGKLLLKLCLSNCLFQLFQGIFTFLLAVHQRHLRKS